MKRFLTIKQIKRLESVGHDFFGYKTNVEISVSLAETMEMLPPFLTEEATGRRCCLKITTDGLRWAVSYDDAIRTEADQLIDAVFGMVYLLEKRSKDERDLLSN